MTGITDAERVWERILTMYRLAERADHAAVDALLSPDVTLWVTDETPLLRGLAQLHAARSRRPDPGQGPAFTIVAREPVIDVRGDLAIARHVFDLLVPGSGSPLLVRNTSVWERVGGDWLLLHNHEDVHASG